MTEPGCCRVVVGSDMTDDQLVEEISHHLRFIEKSSIEELLDVRACCRDDEITGLRKEGGQ